MGSSTYVAIAPDKVYQLKRYAELLQTSGVRPDYGNMSPERRDKY